MKNAAGVTLISNGQLVGIHCRGDELGTVQPGKLADLLVVAGNVVADIALLEDRRNFLAVMQGGIVKAGRIVRN